MKQAKRRTKGIAKPKAKGPSRFRLLTALGGLLLLVLLLAGRGLPFFSPAAVITVEGAVWTGDKSDNWFDKNNWKPKKVPDYDSIVTIRGKKTMPVLTSDINVANLSILTGAVLDLNGRSLTVRGSFFNEGTVRLQCREAVNAGSWQSGGAWEFSGVPGALLPICLVPERIPYHRLLLTRTKNNPTATYALSAHLAVEDRVTVRNTTLDLAGFDLRSRSILNEKTVLMQGSENVYVDELSADAGGSYGTWVLAGKKNGKADMFVLRTRRFGDLQFRPQEGGDTFVVGQGTTVAGTLTVQTGAVLLQYPAILTAGNVEIRGGAFMANGFLTVLRDTVLKKGLLFLAAGGTKSFTNLTVDGGTVRAEGNGNSLRVNGTLDIMTGSFIAPMNLVLGGSIRKHPKAVFDARMGTVTMDGTGQSIVGKIDFYHLNKIVSKNDTLRVGSGSIVSVRGTLTLRGMGKAILSLRSTDPGIPWGLDVRGRQSLERLDVQDGVGMGPTKLQCLVACHDSGRTFQWVFGGR
ncbi:MAG: hypothetical protein PHW10_02175 [Candidatus Peribacteraceae bacterium]|nr:hypothetical protein [Candidatus Peribacteraceae bacterium]